MTYKDLYRKALKKIGEMSDEQLEAFVSEESGEALEDQWGWMYEDKKLLFELSDGMDVSGLTMGLSGCMEYIKGDIDYSLESKDEIKEYTLTPKWMTDEEFKNLPEYQF